MPVNFSEEIPGPVAAILLASGFSKRFGGKNKLLIPFHGKALALYALELAAGMDFSGGIFLVAASDEVAALAANLNAVRVIKNTAPEKGIRESIRLGVEAAHESAAHFLFFHCDQPFLDAATVQSILDARKPGLIVEPRYRGRPGNPCLFSAFFREELLSLGGGETPCLIKTRHPEALRGVEVSSPLALEDVDDEETLKRLLLCLGRVHTTQKYNNRGEKNRA
jgi:molybdenum cofactor cytidylyltransferase